MDIKGKKFHRLLVLYRVGVNKSRNILWKCLCDCGNKTTVGANHLRSGHTKSCGCLHRKIVSKKLKGCVFGRLKVIEVTNLRDGDKNIMWRCICSCGNEIITASRNLLRGDSVSCGCYRLERSIESAKQRCGPLHYNWKGGISCEPYCQDWTKEHKEYIKNRDGNKCLNPDCWKKDDKAGELSIHHIDYNKKNCKSNNLITVCASCNSRANFDRDWHRSWYQAIMYRRYNK